MARPNSGGLQYVYSIISADVFLNVAIIFALLLSIVLPWINTPGRSNDYVIDVPGQLMIRVDWAEDNDVDVDLWGRGPDNVAVGFRNPMSRFFNLLRDDRGNVDDTSNSNYEILFTRGTPNGQYVFNVQLFSVGAGYLPVEVEYVIASQSQPGAPLEIVSEGTVTLSSVGEQATLASFDIIDDTILSHTIDHSTQFSIVPQVVFDFQRAAGN